MWQETQEEVRNGSSSVSIRITSETSSEIYLSESLNNWEIQSLNASEISVTDSHMSASLNILILTFSSSQSALSS